MYGTILGSHLKNTEVLCGEMLLEAQKWHIQLQQWMQWQMLKHGT